MRDVDQERFTELVSWAERWGSGLSPGVEVYDDPLTGFSLRVREGQRIEPGDGVMTCHMSTSFSFVNALARGPLMVQPTESNDADAVAGFPPEFVEALPPHVVGRFFLIKHYLAGKESFWSPYIRTLPQPENTKSWSLPAFWPVEDAAFLEGTNAGVAMQEMQSNLKGEFKQARRILKGLDFPGWRDYTRLLYNWAFSIFTSRSFRPSLVLCEEVADTVVRLLPAGYQLDDFSILLPVFDLANHSLTSRIQWDLSSQPNGCRLVTDDSYGPGAQIFNNYGRKTNGELLLAYGFLLPETEDLHNDYFHLRKKAPGGNAAGPGAATSAGANDEPRDFLVSLRPMNAASSVVGQARQRVARYPSFPVRPELSHVEDSLVWDLCTMGMPEEDRGRLLDAVVPQDTLLGPSASAAADISDAASALRQQREHECLRRILSGPSELPVIESVVQQIKDILLAKLGYEYDKLCETAPGAGDEEGEEFEVEPANESQRLALQYRQQCKKVLENAIGSLVPGWAEEAGMQEA